MNKLLFALSAIVFGLTSVTSATADITVYSNDFEGETVGERPGAPFGAAGNGTGILTVNAADANFPSQYVELGSRSDNGNFFFPFFNADSSQANPGTAFEAVTTFRFDAQFTTDDFTGHRSLLRLRAREEAAPGEQGEDAGRVDLRENEVASDVVSTYRFVINNTSAAADRPDFAGEIAAGTLEFYEGNTMLETRSTEGTSTGAVIDELTLWLQGQLVDVPNPGDPVTQSIVRIDNFSVIVNDPSGDALCGDIDLDGSVTFLDIAPFIEVLAAGGSQPEADCDLSGTVDFLDIAPFIEALANPQP